MSVTIYFRFRSFQDAGLGVDQGSKAPRANYIPPHLRGNSGHPPPDSRRNDFDERGGRSSNYEGRSSGGRYNDRSYNRGGFRDRNDQGRGGYGGGGYGGGGYGSGGRWSTTDGRRGDNFNNNTRWQVRKE